MISRKKSARYLVSYEILGKCISIPIFISMCVVVGACKEQNQYHRAQDAGTDISGDTTDTEINSDEEEDNTDTLNDYWGDSDTALDELRQKCFTYTQKECEQNQDVCGSIGIFQLNLDERCIGEMIYLACSPSAQGGTGAIVWVCDPDGGVYWNTMDPGYSDVLPEGWERCPSVPEGVEDIWDWDPCQGNTSGI